MTLVLAAGAASVSEAKINGYYFKNGGVSVTMDSPAKAFIAKAGKVEKKIVKKSCAYKGKDRIYQYKNFILYTYSNSDKGAEYVQAISFRNKNVATSEGVKIGSAESLVKKKYKKAKEEYGVYTDIKGNTKLQMVVKNGKVQNIRYTANK